MNLGRIGLEASVRAEEAHTEGSVDELDLGSRSSRNYGDELIAYSEVNRRYRVNERGSRDEDRISVNSEEPLDADDSDQGLFAWSLDKVDSSPEVETV